MCVQLTDEQKKWLDVLRLKGSEKKRLGETDAPDNPIRRSGACNPALCSHLRNMQAGAIQHNLEHMSL